MIKLLRQLSKSLGNFQYTYMSFHSVNNVIPQKDKHPNKLIIVTKRY